MSTWRPKKLSDLAVVNTAKQGWNLNPKFYFYTSPLEVTEVGAGEEEVFGNVVLEPSGRRLARKAPFN